MKIILEHTKPETASSDEEWTAYITTKDEYIISKITEVEYNAYKYLQDQLKEVKEFAIWMTGCGYDFTKHDYFIEQRDKLLKNQVDK